MQIPAGVCIVTGSNGAGKSTLLECLAGTCAYRGQITCCGQSPRGKVFATFAGAVLLPWMTGIQQFSILLGRNIEESETVATNSPLLDGVHLRQKCGTYSHGEQQRILVSAAAALAKPVTLIDEQLDALDPDNLRKACEALNLLSHTSCVVVVSHSADAQNLLSPHSMIKIDKGVITHEP